MPHTRRAFLRGSLGGLAGLTGVLGVGCGRNTRARAQDATSPPRPSGPSTVVRVTHGKAHRDGEADADTIAAMVSEGIRRLTGAASAVEGMAALFDPADVVGIKVNCLAGPLLSTHPEVAYALASLLTDAGVRGSNIIIYDRDSSELASAGYDVTMQGAGARCYGTDRVGYDATPTVHESVGTCLSRLVSAKVTALINVPVLKDHDVAGITGALKNHYGSIHNPNKLHMDHCSPYVADLNCIPALRNKGRLVVCDGLVACYDGGPSFKATTSVEHGTLLFGVDPVAVDWVAARMIEKLRAANRLPTLAEEEREPVYIAQAAARSRALGNASAELIEIIDVDMSRN